MRRGRTFIAAAALALATGSAACASAGERWADDGSGAAMTGIAGVGGDREPQRLESNVPMTRLAPGEQPPQFVLFSFDGVGLNPNWDMFLDTAAQVDARFTALMTGLYFVADEHRAVYQGPGHAPGESAIAFGGTTEDVREQVRQLNRTWYGGHEMGTHYVGHFCAGGGFNGDRWSAEDWTHELDQFFMMMRDWQQINGLADAEDLAFGPEAVRGGRTQCLEGAWDRLVPAWHAHGLDWDSSMPEEVTGIVWPRRRDGIWEFAVPYVYSPPMGKGQMALDYNFWFSFNGATEQPETAEEMRRIVFETYMFMYEQAYHGNRAPLVIANHFNDWNGNAFNPATADFMRAVCAEPETICATHADVVDWLALQDPEMVAEWQARPPVAAGPVD